MAIVELLPGVLDSQLRAEAGLTHFEYFVLAMLSEAPERTLRMASLAQRTNATLPRLSHVVRRLEDRGLVERYPVPRGRPSHERPAHRRPGGTPSSLPPPDTSTTVRRHVFDALTPAQVKQLRSIGDALLGQLDPDGRLTVLYDPDRRP